MGLFNYIDTFFFISLGITFVLILLLVFHFKQQITSLEHKNDTMFEIINNIVKELNFIKSSYLVNSAQYHCQPLHEDNEDTIIIQQQPFQSKQQFENKIVVSDDDSYANIKDSDDESDSDDEESDDDNSDDAESDDEVVVVNEEDIDNKIKVINIELGDNIEVNDICTDNDIENENDTEEQPLQDNFENDTSIIVTKLEGDNIENTENTMNATPIHASSFKATKDYYARMNLNELKTLAVTKGLVSDASKMKKIQLIQLLIENP
jgi:hypothetical protein